MTIGWFGRNDVLRANQERDEARRERDRAKSEAASLQKQLQGLLAEQELRSQLAAQTEAWHLQLTEKEAALEAARAEVTACKLQLHQQQEAATSAAAEREQIAAQLDGLRAEQAAKDSVAAAATSTPVAVAAAAAAAAAAASARAPPASAVELLQRARDVHLDRLQRA